MTQCGCLMLMDSTCNNIDRALNYGPITALQVLYSSTPLGLTTRTREAGAVLIPILQRKKLISLGKVKFLTQNPTASKSKLPARVCLTEALDLNRSQEH